MSDTLSKKEAVNSSFRFHIQARAVKDTKNAPSWFHVALLEPEMRAMTKGLLAGLAQSKTQVIISEESKQAS